mgnify:CR=1 FL=1
MRKIQKGDKVQVITWKYKWTVSEVEQTLDEKFIVKWVNVVKKAVKWQGFVEKTMPVQKSNVMYYCSKCKKPVRLWILLDKSWKKVRVCKKCWSQIN